MDNTEFFLAALGIISTFSFAAFFIHRITSLARIRMERKYGNATPEQLAQLDQIKALTEWKTKAENRLRVLEQIVSEEEIPTQEELKPLLDSQINQEFPSKSQSSKIPNQLRNH
jgi:hypothetical protein